MKKIVVSFAVLAFLLSGCELINSFASVLSFKQEPQEAVNEGTKNLIEVTKMNSLFTVKGTIQSPPGVKPGKIQFTAELSNLSDASKDDQINFTSVAKISADVDGLKGAGEVEVRMVDKKMFVKVNKVEFPGEQGKVVADQLASLLNMWWEIPLDSVPLGSMTAEQKALKEKMKGIHFFTKAVEDGEEDVQGSTSTRYRVELDKVALKDFMVEVARAGGTILKPDEEQALADGLKQIDFSGAVSVNGDEVLNRIHGTITIQPSEGPARSFDVDYKGWAFGDKVEITTPEGAKPFSPLVLYPLMSAFSTLQAGEQSAPVAGTSTAPIK